jgi:hypothetical protein
MHCIPGRAWLSPSTAYETTRTCACAVRPIVVGSSVVIRHPFRHCNQQTITKRVRWIERPDRQTNKARNHSSYLSRPSQREHGARLVAYIGIDIFKNHQNGVYFSFKVAVESSRNCTYDRHKPNERNTKPLPICVVAITLPLPSSGSSSALRDEIHSSSKPSNATRVCVCVCVDRVDTSSA